MKHCALYFCFALSFLLFVPFLASGQDFWEQANGPSGHKIGSFAVNSRGELFAGLTGGRVFRSSDSGDNWTARNEGLFDSDDMSILVSPRGIVFASTANGRVFSSENNGDTWTSKNIGLPSQPVRVLAWHPQGYIFTATRTGAYQSKDNGETWLLSGLNNISLTSLVIRTNGDVFVGSIYEGLFRSTDRATSWQQINNGIPNGGYSYYDNRYKYAWSLGIHANGDLYTGAGGGIYRSSGNGKNWVKVFRGNTFNGDWRFLNSIMV